MRRLALGPVVLLAGGCLYLDPVNLPPVAQIHAPTGPFVRGDVVVLDGSASRDAEDATVSYAWSVVACPTCSPEAGPPGPTFQVSLTDHAVRTVTLVVLDSHGAPSSPATVSLAITNRPPAFELAVTTPDSGDGTFTLSRPVTIAVTNPAPDHADPDLDLVTYQVRVQAPPTSDPNQASVRTPAVGVWSITPDVSGHWALEVTSSDGFGGVTIHAQGFEVAPDRPPCLALTTPEGTTDGRYLLQRDGDPRRFAVESIVDDLDPFPGSGEHFSWSVGPAGQAPALVAGHDLPDFTLDPSGHLPGEVLTLRVEIADRLPRTLPCDPAQPRCAIGGDQCFQRLSWAVEIR